MPKSAVPQGLPRPAPLALRPSTTGPARSLLASRRLRRARAEFGQQPFDLVGGPGRAEEEALHLVAAFGAQPVQLVHGFDALGRRGDVETAAKAGDRPHDRDAIGALRQVLDEGAIDL